MSFMHDECVFEAAAGSEVCGARHVGREAVKKAFAAAWEHVADAQWTNGRHVVHGNFGVSQWTFVGTAGDGSRIEADGVDIFTFKDGKILVKNAFRKARPPLAARR
jgi:ketosteroid isomerase-like protein